MAPSKPRLLFVRRRPNPHNTHQNRSLSNFDALVAHLHAQSWSSAIEFRVVDFADLTLCEQACEAHQSAVLVAQHGAGLANAAYLRDRGRAAVVEICPKSMWYKSIFQCLAGLRGAHYGRIQQTDIHGPVDVAAVADAVAAVLEVLPGEVAVLDHHPQLLGVEHLLLPQEQLHHHLHPREHHDQDQQHNHHGDAQHRC